MDSRNSSTPKPNFNGVQHLNTKTDLPKDAKEILISTQNTDNQVNIHSSKESLPLLMFLSNKY